MTASLTRISFPLYGASYTCNAALRALSSVPKRTLHLSSSHQNAKPKDSVPRAAAPIPAGRVKVPPPTARSSSKGPPSRSPPPPADGKAPIDTIFQQRKYAFIGAGFAALILGFYTTSVVSSLVKKPSCAACACEQPSSAILGGEPVPPTGRPPALDEARQTAEAFDRELDVPEWLSGIKKLRKNLASYARGRVLEVAVGTGRNLGYYDWTELVDGVALVEEDAEKARDEREKREKERAKKVLNLHRLMKNGEVFDEEKAKLPGQFEGEILSYTGVDISPDMMGVARRRLRDTVPGLKKLLRRKRAEPMPASGAVVDVLDSRVRLCIADAEQPLPPPPPGSAAPPDTEAGKYDTILQSFGLCSVSNPVKLVTNMASVLQPGSGRIFLLEHGRGWFEFLNGLMDETAEAHFKKHGCWWNRDIEGIVREATRSVPGLEIVHLGRLPLRHLGTTLVVELRVNPDAAAQQSAQSP